MTEVHCDSLEDLRKELLARLKAWDMELTAETDVQRVALEYFHLEHRLIQPVPRTVAWSTQLRARALSKRHRQAVEAIADELRRGADVAPRMTKTIRDAGYNDGLLTDWGIHHLHLGQTTGPDGFAARSGALLFVFVSGEAAYLLDVLDHGSFEDEVLIEIIHENWPQAIAHWRLPVEPDSGPVFRGQNRRRMRRRVVTLTQTRDGTAYAPLGGGVVMSGHSLVAGRRADAVMTVVHRAEVWVREQADQIADQVERLVGARLPGLNLRLARVEFTNTGPSRRDRSGDQRLVGAAASSRRERVPSLKGVG